MTARNVGAFAKDRAGIDVLADIAGDVGFRRQGQRQRRERGLERLLGEHGRKRLDQPFVAVRAAVVTPGHVVDQHAGGERLQRLPAVERIGIVRREETQIILTSARLRV